MTCDEVMSHPKSKFYFQVRCFQFATIDTVQYNLVCTNRNTEKLDNQRLPIFPFVEIVLLEESKEEKFNKVNGNA